MTSGPAAPARPRFRASSDRSDRLFTPYPASSVRPDREPPPTVKPHARVPGRDHHRHPQGTDSAEVARRRAVEAVRAKVPAATGNLFRLWHSVGGPRSIGVWRAAAGSLVRGPRRAIPVSELDEPVDRTLRQKWSTSMTA
ncbi:muconolactone Delta-isomerase family protein [Streptomyces sp. NPDC057460]|uniref:muconolactone Delta-isomerase family protein n=1 Tax=Streptomyces sp. NPDC057460 TaxID=3346141 RepID=UPI0036746021